MPPQAEISVPVVLNAIIEQVSRATAGSPLLADTHKAEKQAAAEAAVEAAFQSTSADHGHESEAAPAQPQGKKIIYEGDLFAATAAGIVTGVCLTPITCSSCKRFLAITCMGQSVSQKWWQPYAMSGLL